MSGHAERSIRHFTGEMKLDRLENWDEDGGRTQHSPGKPALHGQGAGRRGQDAAVLTPVHSMKGPLVPLTCQPGWKGFGNRFLKPAPPCLLGLHHLGLRCETGSVNVHSEGPSLLWSQTNGLGKTSQLSLRDAELSLLSLQDFRVRGCSRGGW